MITRLPQAAVERSRRAWIEVLALFEGGLTARRLAQRVGLSIPTAQRAIGEYQSSQPGWLRYDRQARVHRLAKAPVEASSEPGDYLGLLRGVALVEICAPLLLHDDTPIIMHLVEHYLPQRATGPALTLCEALQNQKVVQAVYRSKNGVNFHTFSPHRLVHADQRYHVRGFLHDGSGHTVDLILGRFMEATIEPGGTWVGPEHDHDWHQEVRLVIQLNPELQQEARLLAALDWMMSDEEKDLQMVMPSPLAFYVERDLRRHQTDGLPTFKLKRILIGQGLS